MILNAIDSYSIRIVTMYCSFTCIYMPLLILILIYTDNLYKIGKYSCMPLLAGIVLAECIKVGSGFLLSDISFGSKDTKSAKVKKSYTKLKLAEIFKCACIILGSTAIFYILAVLFGAPLLTECEETLTLAILMTSLSVLPSCMNVGADNTLSLLTGVKPALNNVVMEMILRNIQITVIGAWLGAIVIPLDWDRPWQAWPIPCCVGTMLGYVISHILTLVKVMPNIVRVFTGKR